MGGRGRGLAWLRPLIRAARGGWGKVPTYSKLHRELADHGLPKSPEAFAEGPFRRFLELALADGLSAGERMRILEHARSWAGKMEQAVRDHGGGPQRVRDLVQGELTRVTADHPVMGRWISKAFSGPYFHHAPPPFPPEVGPQISSAKGR